MTVLAADPFGPLFSPAASAALLGLALLYLRGAAHPRLAGAPNMRRHALFAAGAGLLVLSVDGPLAAAGHRLFAAHQLQHLVIRLLGPMLIVLARPWPVLRAGLPRPARRALARTGERPAARIAARLLGRVDVSFGLLVVALYLWQVPALHNAAVGLPSLVLLAHATMALAGLNFFAVVFDPHDPPQGAAHGRRLLALVGVILSNILLGSLTTLKEAAIYTAYGIAKRAGGFTPMGDEVTGGYTIWVPSSFVIVAAIILVFNGWNRAEERRWNARGSRGGSNSAALEFPETAWELHLKVTGPNRRLGRVLGLISAAMFAGVMITGIALIYAL